MREFLANAAHKLLHVGHGRVLATRRRSERLDRSNRQVDTHADDGRVEGDSAIGAARTACGLGEHGDLVLNPRLHVRQKVYASLCVLLGRRRRRFRELKNASCEAHGEIGAASGAHIGKLLGDGELGVLVGSACGVQLMRPVVE